MIDLFCCTLFFSSSLCFLVNWYIRINKIYNCISRTTNWIHLNSITISRYNDDINQMRYILYFSRLFTNLTTSCLMIVCVTPTWWIKSNDQSFKNVNTQKENEQRTIFFVVVAMCCLLISVVLALIESLFLHVIFVYPLRLNYFPDMFCFGSTTNERSIQYTKDKIEIALNSHSIFNMMMFLMACFNQKFEYTFICFVLFCIDYHCMNHVFIWSNRWFIQKRKISIRILLCIFVEFGLYTFILLNLILLATNSPNTLKPPFNDF